MSDSAPICERCREDLPAATPNEAHEANDAPRMTLCPPCREKLLGSSTHRGRSQFRVAKPQPASSGSDGSL